MKNTFLIDAVFGISKRGIVATGEVKRGRISVGMEGKVHGKKVRVKNVEKFNKILREAVVGDLCGLCLEGEAEKKDFIRGELLSISESESEF
jgi:translation elongation factor EF-Tu-like GTPase